MRTISHRDLRNNSAAVLRAVVSGETYAITNHGTVVARLSPPTENSDLLLARPATKRPTYATRRRVKLNSSSSEMLDDLRGDR